MLILQIPAPRIYLTVGGFAGAAALLFYLLIGWKLARRRLEKLGHRVPLVASKLPFGTFCAEFITPTKFPGSDTHFRCGSVCEGHQPTLQERVFQLESRTP